MHNTSDELNSTTTEIFLKTSNTNFPYITLPRCLRFLSFKAPDGKEIRITLDHIGLLHYFHELEFHYKSMRTMASETGISLEKLNRLKKELTYPCVEIDTSLLKVSEFRDVNNNLRHQLELFADYDKLASYDKYLFEEFEGKSRRDRWINQWKISRGGVFRKSKHGCFENRNEDNLNTENLTTTTKTNLYKTNLGKGGGTHKPKKIQITPSSYSVKVAEKVVVDFKKKLIEQLKDNGYNDHSIRCALKYASKNKDIILSKPSPVGWVIAGMKGGWIKKEADDEEKLKKEIESTKNTIEENKKSAQKVAEYFGLKLKALTTPYRYSLKAEDTHIFFSYEDKGYPIAYNDERFAYKLKKIWDKCESLTST